MNVIRPAIAVFLTTSLLLAGWGCRGKESEKASNASPVIVKGATIQSITETAIPEEVEVVGTVRSRNSAVIAARIAGTITSVRVRQGDRVGEGSLLATIEATESVAGAAGARAVVEEAKRGGDDALARKRLADATYSRYSTLYREQAVTRQELDGKRMERDVAEQGVARSGARLQQAREGARAAGAVAGYTRIFSPIAGIVTGKSVDSGMTVFPGTPLLTVEEEGHYRLEAAAPELLLGQVKLGDKVRLAIDGIGESLGRVSEVVPAVEQGSRTFTVKMDIGATGLRSGLFGRAYLPVGSRRGILVPAGAVVERGAITSVWVVGSDSFAKMRLVRVGRVIGGEKEILSGLSPGEKIVFNGVDKIVDGAKVE